MMKRKVIKIFLNSCYLLFLLTCITNAAAQTIKYSSQNVFIANPDKVHLVSNINGYHHLLSFTNQERPLVSIFNEALELKTQVKIPFKFPERSPIMIIPFVKFYYILIRSYYNPKYLFWKVDERGNVTDMSALFQKLKLPRAPDKISFQLISQNNSLYMIFHTNPDPEHKQTNILQLDSMLNIVHANKVQFDLRSGEGQLQREILLDGELVILRTARMGTSLILTKVNLATGNIVTYSYYSTYQYMHPNIRYNPVDSSFTVYSVLTQKGNYDNVKHYVFISRLNHSLIEETPFAILKSQFLKNTATNFLLVDGYGWNNFNSGRSFYTLYANNFSRDLQDTFSTNFTRRLPNTPARYYTEEVKQAVRFSIADKNFKIKSDTLFLNNKNAHTLQTGKVAMFTANNKNYLLVGQRFLQKSNGLLMINESNDELVFTDVRVNNRNDYLLSEAKTTANGVIIPYKQKREAGLVKISVE